MRQAHLDDSCTSVIYHLHEIVLNTNDAIDIHDLRVVVSGCRARWRGARCKYKPLTKFGKIIYYFGNPPRVVSPPITPCLRHHSAFASELRVALQTMADLHTTSYHPEHNESVSSGHTIYSEILSVTSIMRKNSRWSSSMQTFYTKDSALASNLGLRRPGSNSVSTPQQGSREEDLMSGFEELKRTLRSARGMCYVSDVREFAGKNLSSHLIDVSSIPIAEILAPFLAIIRSPLSTGPITSAALSALHSFFTYGLFMKNDQSVDAALAELSSSVSHCKFEASDSSGDEVVLLRILTVIEDCICGSWSPRLGDVEVCEMLETVLATCVQMRLSGPFSRYDPCCPYVHMDTEALRRSAELTMHKIVRTVLSKLYILDPASEEKRLLSPPSVPVAAAGTDPSASTPSSEPSSDDPGTGNQLVASTAQITEDASRVQKLGCTL